MNAIVKMLSFKKWCKYLTLVIWLDFVIKSRGSQLYVTNMKCNNMDDKFLTINTCFTRRLSRTASESSMNITLLEEVTSAGISLEFVKKSNNKYNNYLYKTTSFNGCKFMEKRSISPLANYIFSFLEEYTNLNHSCPYKGSIIIDRFRIDVEKVKWIPIPPGDYGIVSHWYAQGKEKIVVSFYFTFTE